MADTKSPHKTPPSDIEVPNPAKSLQTEIEPSEPAGEKTGGEQQLPSDGRLVPASKSEGNPEPEQPYSVFSKHEIAFIVFCASLAALFSPLSANIYYPALTTLATELNVSNSLINLTVTTYLIFQGLAPSFIGAISDARGRRPSYIICFVIYISACIGLALQNNYAALLVLRCLQSSGSSGTIALANAVVSDVSTSADRGTYMGYAFMGALLGPAIGPVVGGLLIDFLGWRSVFWFLVIFAGVTLCILLALLPETCRVIVGNGSVPPARWNYSIIAYLRFRKLHKAGTVPYQHTTATPKRSINPLKAFLILGDKESAVILFFSGSLFAGYYMVITALTSQLQAAYGFNTLQVGLCYIPLGCGSVAAAFTIGQLMNMNWRRHCKILGMEIVNNKQQDITNFPIEAARLEVMFPLVFTACVSVIVYGWTLEKHVSLAAPLIFIFLMSFSLSGSFQPLNTLVIDLNRESPGSASAASNLTRCWLGAAGVAIVQPLLKAIGNGWVCVLVAGFWLMLSPIVLLVMKHGPKWRREKREREAEREERLTRKDRNAEAAEEGMTGESPSITAEEK